MMPIHLADAKLTVHCDCQDPAHIMQLHLVEWEEEEPALYVSVQLNPRHPWWKRAWIALGYVCGRRSRFSYGHWDEGSISPESAKELVGLLQRYLFTLNRGTTTTGTGELTR